MGRAHVFMGETSLRWGGEPRGRIIRHLPLLVGLTMGGRWASANAKTFFEGLGLGGEREILFLGGGWASRGECDMFVYLRLAPGASATCSFVWGAFVFGGECEILHDLGARLQGLVQHIL